MCFIKKIPVIVLVMLLWIVSGQHGKAQSEKYRSWYLYNICEYIEWPSETMGDRFIIGVVGNNSKLMRELHIMSASKTIQNKHFVVRQIKSNEDAVGCNVLFFNEGYAKDSTIDGRST